MPIHTAGAWEEVVVVVVVEGEEGEQGRKTMMYLETSRVHDNAFPFFPADDGRLPAKDAHADFVRWELDLSKPSGSRIADPTVVLDLPSEFPRIDERFLGQPSSVVFLCVFRPKKAGEGRGDNFFHGLNTLAMHSHRTNATRYYYAGDGAHVQEPVFIPRTEDTDEGDGWVMTMVDRPGEGRNELVVLDTRSWKPVAVVMLPFRSRAQVHGNWVCEGTLRVAGVDVDGWLA